MNDMKLKDDRKSQTQTKTLRAALSPRLRFKILKRDGFTCQYCGRTTSDNDLEIDHIIPVSKGGTNDEGNLITSCIKCNQGKRDMEIMNLYNNKDVSGISILQTELRCSNCAHSFSRVKGLLKNWLNE